MALKNYKPVTPGSRYKTSLDFSLLTKVDAERSLTKGIPFKAGRGGTGRISVRRKGGRNKRLYRVVDFRRDKPGVPGRVQGHSYVLWPSG